MTATDAQEATHVRDTGHLSSRDITDATGAAPNTVRIWLTGRSAPSGARVDLLDDDKPIERIAAGDHRAVARLISGLEDPGAA